ncbi:MAG: hypothetical protein ACRD03_06035 [Acidimicrobiales bacterium]
MSSSRASELWKGRTGRRQRLAFGAAVTGGLVALAGTAFACTSIAGRISVQEVVGGVPTGAESVTVGSRGVDPVTGDGMAFCSDPGSIKGGASADQGDTIRIVVEPWVCINGGSLIDKAFNNLGTDPDGAEITWVAGVFGRSGGAYTYTRNVDKDCHILDGDNTIVSTSKMTVVDGFGAIDVAVPSSIANSGPSDAAAVCVRSEDVLEGKPDPALWAEIVVAMAPLVVL